MTIGSKYKWKANDNPAPGQYDVEKAEKSIRHKSPEAFIKEPLIKYKRPQEPTPEPYDGHLKSFGSDVKGSVDFGNKYITKIDRNPGVGYYNPNESMTKSKSVSTIIKTTPKVEKARTIFPKETDEGPDYMSSAVGSFGNGAQSFTMGKKYKDERRDGPGPGEYDTDASLNITKESIKGKTYIAADNDFDKRNSFQNASLERKSRYSNKYLYKNMSPDSRNKVINSS